ncbi:kinase-like domain-containing protein, partial [Amylostereum chailletii]
FVAAHTSIPVPRPLLCFRWRAASYILMTRVPGHDLEQVWERLDAPARDAILAQLAPYTAQLRAIPSPHGPAVCSVLAGPVHDMRLPSAHRGPFPDEPAMNHVLRGFHDPRDLPPAVAAAHARPHPIVFTHGDLAPRNVMVRGTTVTGIIDWGAAGWFPAHWEYRKARWAVFDALADAWIPYLPRFIPPFPLEADADDYLDRRFWYPS